MYNHNKAQQNKNRVHISWDILYVASFVGSLEKGYREISGVNCITVLAVGKWVHTEQRFFLLEFRFARYFGKIRDPSNNRIMVDIRYVFHLYTFQSVIMPIAPSVVQMVHARSVLRDLHDLDPDVQVTPMTVLVKCCCIRLKTLRPEQNSSKSLGWRHNEGHGVLNHRRFKCLLNRLFKRISKKASKLRVTGLCEGWPPKGQ